ncbi:hypothetical protein E1267_01955 [Nonomuraea longispora]|uniref:YCII-related domain-containing protein n=1 Tax=Nonomuraea longispora TaxID=1848320 RepID=A0A4V2XLM4_9ACTN|nr:YciI family protein [Nonomuraea longispora]TDC10986.1 hypothetical protein E1267_01955 [Nonomuraea longispora]
MQFALLLFDPEGCWESVSREEMEAALAEHAAFAQYLRDQSIPFYAQAVNPAKEAKTLRPSPHGPVSTAGPFVALDEGLAGFYVVECADLDEAERIARHCPMGAGIEIRPVWDAPS